MRLGVRAPNRVPFQRLVLVTTLKNCIPNQSIHEESETRGLRARDTLMCRFRFGFGCFCASSVHTLGCTSSVLLLARDSLKQAEQSTDQRSMFSFAKKALQYVPGFGAAPDAGGENGDGIGVDKNATLSASNAKGTSSSRVVRSCCCCLTRLWISQQQQSF